MMLRHLSRFAVVGVINTGVYYACYLLVRTIAPYLVAHLVALAVGMVVSFLLNCYWTFRTRPTWRKFLVFPLTNATNSVLMTVGVIVLVEWLHVGQRIAPLIAAVAAIPVTFVLSRWVLVGRPVGDPVPAEGPVPPDPALAAADGEDR